MTPGAPPLLLRATTALTASDVAAILALAEASAGADGAHPLSEHVVLHLRNGDPGSTHLLAVDPATGALLGYAHLADDPAEGPSAELAVSPDARRRGVGTLLIDDLLRRTAERPGLRLWAHGRGAAAGRLAATRGFDRIRHLWQMRRSLLATLDPVVLPSGIALRPFEADRDIDALLALNARAFVELPDQGSWTRADLVRRIGEPWFDPAGLQLAHDAHGALLGFGWTKVHGRAEGPGGQPDHPHDPLGEVYVLGVDPPAQGRGLGRALALAGVHHLRARGLTTALLYVDSDNARAIALYTSLGFATWDSDTLFRR